MPPGKHSRLGGSKSKRWIACPGSVAMEDGIPETHSLHASLGTAAHDLAERCLTEDLDPHDCVGDIIPGRGDEEHLVDEDMADAVKVYVDHCRALAASAERVWIEQHFNLGPLNPPEPMYGTADFVAWDGDTLHVVDYKHGAGVNVEAEGNTQMVMYATGVLVQTRLRPRRITMTIVQPRCEQGPPVDPWTLTLEELAEESRKLMDAARRASADNGETLNPGDHCRFCRARPRCPAQARLVDEAAQMMFVPEVEAEETGVVAPEMLSASELSKALDIADQIEAWFQAVRDHVHQLLETGEEVPGYRLAPKRASRKWSDEEEVVSYLSKKRVPKKLYETRKLKSPAQMEKALKDRGVEFPDDLVTKESSGTKVVREDSSAPIALPKAQSLFTPTK